MRTSTRSSFASMATLAFLTACGADDGAPPDAPKATETGSIAPSPTTPTDPTPTPTPTASGPRQAGIVFMHGTSDRGHLEELGCSGTGDDWHCSTTQPEDIGDGNSIDYWTQEMIDSGRTRPDGTRRPFIAVGCPASANTPWPNPNPVKPAGGPPEPGSASCVGPEIVKFLNGPDGAPGTDDDIDDVAIITHSGGGNVIRFVLQQHSASPDFERVHAATRGVMTIAAPFKGTYLGDVIASGGFLANLDKLVGMGYDDDGILFTQVATMALYNADPAKFVDTSKDVAGVPFYVSIGATPDTSGPDDLVSCAGSAETLGLSVLHGLYYNSNDPATLRDSCSDGMVSCQTALSLANGDLSRIVFGVFEGKPIGQVHFRAHNQTRRSCNGVDLDVRATLNKILAQGEKPPAALAAETRGERERYSPIARRVVHQSNGVDFEVPLSVSAGQLARVRIGANYPTSGVEAFVEDPSRTWRLPVTPGKDTGGDVVADVAVPATARPGAWTLHMGSREDLEQHRGVRVPVWVSTADGSIVGTRAVRREQSIVVEIDARVKGASRVGVRATLVSEVSGESWVVTSSQKSVDMDPTRETVHFALPLAVPAGIAANEHLVVRDVALIAHDDASTLDIAELVPVQR